MPENSGTDSNENTQESEVSETTRSFEALLNRHGYGFVYAVLKAIEKEPHAWRFVAPEFPVEVQRRDTRIDFLLRHFRRHFFIVAECKRANPATANWCFVRAPEIAHSTYVSNRAVLIEELRNAGPEGYARQVHKRFSSDRIYHHAIEVRTGSRGDAGGKNTDEIETAVTQVLRGTNGFAAWCARNPVVVSYPAPPMMTFLPVIFTSAKLFVSSVDLADSDLTSGMVDLSKHPATETPWLHYQYQQSPGLLNDLHSAEEHSSIRDALYADYTRTVTFVSSSAVGDFLKWASHQIEYDF